PAIDALPGQERLRLLRALSGHHLVVAFQRARDLEEHGGLVIHDEHARARGLAHAAVSGATGSVNQACVPMPGWLSRPKRPACCSTIRCTSVSPNPLPVDFVVNPG